MTAYSHHDVKFPLQVAMALAESIKHDVSRLKPRNYELEEQTEELRSSLVKTREKAKPMGKLRIRDISIECKFEPMDIILLVDAAIKMANTLGTKHNITVGWVNRPTTPVMINADKDYLSTALYALFENAVKYSFDQRTVDVYATCERQQLTLRISDFGVGLKPESVLTLFEFGARAKIEEYHRDKSRVGAGLGLTIAHRIIKAHGGDLRLTTSQERSEVSEENLAREVSAIITLPIAKSL
jgi:signal transduction histidine kinase